MGMRSREKVKGVTRMKIRFQAPKGQRFKKQFMCVELDNETTEGWLNWLDWCYYPESNEWRKDSGFKSGETYASSSCNCRSLKSAIRLIKKWGFPKGTTFRLHSIWVGHDVYITVQGVTKWISK
jgi:hypothetical protein